MSLPVEILDPTERLLQLLQGSENVPERTMERATRLLRPVPSSGLPDYAMALKMKLKQSILENASSSSSGSMALASFEKECERIRKINPALLQSTLILMEPLAFSKSKKTAEYFSQFQSSSSSKQRSGGSAEAGEEAELASVPNAIKDTIFNINKEGEKNKSNYGKGKVSTVEVIDQSTIGKAGDVAWVNKRKEELLLRDLIFVFQGIEGKYIRYDQRTEAYEIDKSLNLLPSVRDTVLCLCEIGWLYGRVASYISSSNAGSSGDSSSGKGVVVQSFGSALEEELQDYFRLLSILENEMSKVNKARKVTAGEEGKLGGLSIEEKGSAGNPLGTSGPLPSSSAAAMASWQGEGQGAGAGAADSDGAGGGLTLLRLRMWMQEPLERLYLMARLVDSAGPLKGGALASRLHGHTQNGDEAATSLVRRVLGTVCTPLYDMLGRWVLHGELHDPHQEFFVGHRAGVPNSAVWQEGYFLRVSMLPTYLPYSVAKKVLVIGKSINFIKLCSSLLAKRQADNALQPNLPSEAKNLKERKEGRAAMRRRESKLRKHYRRSIESVTTRRRTLDNAEREDEDEDEDEDEEEEEDEEGSDVGEEDEEEDGEAFTMTGQAAAVASAAALIGPALSYAGEGQLVESVNSLARDVDRRLLALIQSKYAIQAHLHALKQFLLLSQGDFVICLMDVVGPELRKRANLLYRHNLTGMLESALRGSNAQYLSADVLDRVNVKLLQPNPGDTGWEVFTLDYSVDPPLSAVVHPEAMVKYRQVFHLLWRLKRVEWTLAGAWKNLLVFSHSRDAMEGSNRLQKVLHRCSLNRARMLHVVTTINTYLMFEVLDSEWQALLEKLGGSGSGGGGVSSLDELIATHDTYLDNILSRALLTAADESLFLQLKDMLQSVLRFCSLEETLVADAMAALARKRSRADAARRSNTSGGGEDGWANTSDVSSEDPDSYDGVPSYVVHRIDEAVRDYSAQFDAFMSKLGEQGDAVRDMNRFLALRLDFNGYHAQEKSKGNSGVVTSTPPVVPADASKAQAASQGRSRLSFT